MVGNQSWWQSVIVGISHSGESVMVRNQSCWGISQRGESVMVGISHGGEPVMVGNQSWYGISHGGISVMIGISHGRN